MRPPLNGLSYGDSRGLSSLIQVREAGSTKFSVDRLPKPNHTN